MKARKREVVIKPLDVGRAERGRRLRLYWNDSRDELRAFLISSLVVCLGSVIALLAIPYAALWGEWAVGLVLFVWMAGIGIGATLPASYHLLRNISRRSSRSNPPA